MLNTIKNFMQANDRNGEWMTCTSEDKAIMLHTLQTWAVEQDMPVTAEIQSYMDYLAK